MPSEEPAEHAVTAHVTARPSREPHFCSTSGVLHSFPSRVWSLSLRTAARHYCSRDSIIGRLFRLRRMMVCANLCRDLRLEMFRRCLKPFLGHSHLPHDVVKLFWPQQQ